MTDVAQLQAAIERYVGGVPAGAEHAAREAVEALKALLNTGTVRAAERGPDGRWQANTWVKAGILLGFRIGAIVPVAEGSPFPFFDKDTYPLRKLRITDGVRVVPGGSSIRDGAYVARGVVCMPPMYINVGAYVDEGTMVDSHALVGSCAQVGRRVHLSAAAQIGGVLEPPNAVPVVIEDDVLVGGNCGVYEGTIVRERAVLAPGVLLTGGTPVYDLVHDRVYRRDGDQPLEIPAGAVVVPGSRPVTSGPGAAHGVHLYAPVIIKYRDEKTDAAVRIEELLR
jgi:2,3,4,5-tetrahydropyridine-2-carboxylate N-succinyltransferase